MKPYNIHIAHVLWSDSGKRRPVLIISFDEKEVAIFRITSQYENKSDEIKSLYIAIDDWEEAGLNKQSYIDIGRVFELPINVTSPDPIGELTERDLHKLFNALKIKK